jgi:hypothetical protein
MEAVWNKALGLTMSLQSDAARRTERVTPPAIDSIGAVRERLLVCTFRLLP